jgi:B12-binding domain/radical SAM domain protein
MSRWVVFRRHARNRNTFASLIAAMSRVDALREIKTGFLDRPGGFPKGTAVVGYSFVTGELPEVAAEVQVLRKQTTNRPWIVAGGPHASADPQGTLAMGFDAVFVGEGEETFPRFLSEVFDNGKPRTDTWVHQGPGVDLNQLFCVDALHHQFPFVEISRGCPHACEFCHVPVLFGRRPRFRSPQVVKAGIELAVKAGYKRFRYLAPDAFSYRIDGLSAEESLSHLLAGGSAAGATEHMLGCFPSEVRPDHVTKDLLRLVRTHCRNRTVVLGAQSGSNRVLDLMKRGHTVEQAREAIRLVAESDLRPHVDVLFCFPGELPEERQETLDLVLWCIEKAKAKVHAHVYLPLPGAPAWPKNPEKMEEEISRMLRRLQAAHQLDGDWDRQALMGRKILRWREEGLVLV